MAILGAIPGQVAIPKVGGGYTVNSSKQNYQYYGYTPPKKKTTTPTIKTTVPASAKVAANYQTVQAPQVASAPVAPPVPTMDDLIKRYYDASTGDVNSLYDQQKSSQLASLKAQRDQAIGKINQQQDQTKQEYYDKRNQADVTNAQNIQRLREIMAANGVSTSGENLTLNAQANSDRLNALNTLNQQEQGQMNDYASQIADWNNPARDQSIVSQIEAARAQALQDAKNAAYARAWNEFQFNNISAGDQASLAMNRYNIDATNAANSASSQAALDYYNSLGFNSGSGGGGTASFNANMSKAVQRGVDPSWVPLLTEIVRRESSFNPNAKNPKSTAYGYGQFLNSTRSAYEKKMGLSYSDPVNQLIMMAQYVKDRYGNPQNALAFWNKNHWY